MSKSGEAFGKKLRKLSVLSRDTDKNYSPVDLSLIYRGQFIKLF